MKHIAEADGVLGEFVYEPCSPQKCGKIVALRPSKNPFFPKGYATVKYITGDVEETHVAYLRKLESLIEDHRHKLQFHEKNLEKAKLL